MTFVGKVLVVVQVVLSLCFMAFAGAVYSVQTSWKAEAESRQEDIGRRETEYNDLRQEFDDFQDEKNVELTKATGERDSLQAQKADLERRLKASDGELQTARAQLESLTAQIALTEQEAADRREQALIQRQKNEELYALLDQYRIDLLASKDAGFSTGKELERALARIGSLQDTLRQYLVVLNNAGIDPDTTPVAASDAPPPRVNGLVLETRKGENTSTEYVEISIGSDDGLLKGHELLVFRVNGTGKYLGKIQLVHVTPDRSVGTVLEKAKNGVIQRGDHVATKL
ncbi:MAG: hypothetical protein WED34_02165 [Planctomycetales bacterium]